MRTIDVITETVKSKIYIGEKIENLKNYLPNSKVIIITDENLNHYYSDKFPENVPVVIMGVGEQNKTIETVQKIFSQLIDLEADRSTFIVGIGGGIVCDVTGYVASTYMRGVRFGFVSTTLLSQVDASVGGKNGVNFQGFKNMVGVFSQPEFVICDIDMLSTLKREEFVSGFAEIVKAGAIREKSIFTYLEDNYAKALEQNKEVLEKIIFDSVLMKADIVAIDEKEAGLRKILNFGHTFAHSFEKHSGVSHGAAVSIGMVLASRLSVNKGLISMEDANRLETLLRNLELPIKIELEKEKIVDAIHKDKKRKGDKIGLVLLKKIGEATIENVPINTMEEIVNDLC